MDLIEHKANWDRLAIENSPEWVVDTRKTEWDSEEFFETGRVLIDDLLGYVNANNVAYSSGKALDFGCGVGRLSQSLCSYFDHVDGTDISDEMIRQATLKNRHGEKCSYFVSNSDQLDSIQDDHYDVVFTYATLQHIEPFFVEKYLKSFMRILKPGGVLLFQEHAYAYDRNERIKDFVKGTLPRTWVNRIKKAKNKDNAIMEVFAIPKAKITEIIRANNGEVLCSREEPNASGSHKTYFYVVRKLGSS